MSAEKMFKMILRNTILCHKLALYNTEIAFKDGGDGAPVITIIITAKDDSIIILLLKPFKPLAPRRAAE